MTNNLQPRHNDAALTFQSSNQQLRFDSLQLLFVERRPDNSWLIPDDNGRNKNERSRMNLYVSWLNEHDYHWTQPALADYARYLLSDTRGLSASSTNAHLSTIRGVFRQHIDEAILRQRLEVFADEAMPQVTPSDKRVLVQKVMLDLEDALNPALTKRIVKQVTKQDTLDSTHIRLTNGQADRLMQQPSLRTVQGVRDTALISFALCTGLREAELCNLNIDNLRSRVGDELGVYIHEGKGAKSRFVPYGALDWCLQYVDAWLGLAGITEGAVFRGVSHWQIGRKQVNKVRTKQLQKYLTERLIPRSVQNILKTYPIMVDGEETVLTPHDLRRTYARLLWDSGMDIIAIRDNLGHADIKTTQGYIGDMDMHKRRASALYREPDGDVMQFLRWMAQKNE